jgi:hypothetical protein
MTIRIMKVFMSGVLSFLIAFVLVALFTAAGEYFLCWHSVDNYGRGRLQLDQWSILKELWIRRFIPPSFGCPCYTSNIYVCTLADAVAVTTGLIGVSWVWEVVMSFISSLTTMILLFVYSRQTVGRKWE